MRRTYAGIIVFGVLALCLVAGGPLMSQDGPEGLKIGVVNLPEVFNNHPEFVKYEKKFEEDQKAYEAQMLQRQKELRDLEDQISKVQPDTSKYRDLAREYSLKEAEFKFDKNAKYSLIMQQAEQITKVMFRDIYEVIEKYGKANGFSVILKTDSFEMPKDFRQMQAQISQRSVLYHTDTVDLTGEIIAILNKTGEGEKKDE